MYTFSKVSSDYLPQGTSNIMNIGGETVDEQCLTIGRIKTLFGEPNYVTKNNENLYSYTICVKEDDEIVTYLELYHGPSGNAIGGTNDTTDKIAAESLNELIQASEPTDYKYFSVYTDFNVLIKMSVKNGVPDYKPFLIPGLSLFYYKGREICYIIILVLIIIDLYLFFTRII